MKIVISGAISNDENFMEKFINAEKKIREQYPDAEIFNPAVYCENLMRQGIIRREQDSKKLWLNCMCYCLPEFEDATHIYFIDDEICSDGRLIEKIVASHMGMEFLRK